MATLIQLVHAGRRLCAIGFDDGPFDRRAGSPVPVGGVVCSGTRFEGMVWGRATRDGTDATQVLADLLLGSKFANQVHVVLTDGIAVGGLNVVDLAALHAQVGRPCVAVMRRPPDRVAMRRAVARLPDPDARWARIEAAGAIHTLRGFTLQVVGAEPDDAARVLEALTDRGKVPEPLRLAHLIGAAVVRGESSKRA